VCGADTRRTDGEPLTTPEQPISIAQLPRARINASWLPSAWVAYLILGCLITTAYFTILDPTLQDPVYNLLGISAVGAIAIGIWRWNPVRRRGWILLAVGGGAPGRRRRDDQLPDEPGWQHAIPVGC
jgi:hypothetical protein